MWSELEALFVARNASPIKVFSKLPVNLAVQRLKNIEKSLYKLDPTLYNAAFL